MGQALQNPNKCVNLDIYHHALLQILLKQHLRKTQALILFARAGTSSVTSLKS